MGISKCRSFIQMPGCWGRREGDLASRKDLVSDGCLHMVILVSCSQWQVGYLVLRAEIYFGIHSGPGTMDTKYFLNKWWLNKWTNKWMTALLVSTPANVRHLASFKNPRRRALDALPALPPDCRGSHPPPISVWGATSRRFAAAARTGWQHDSSCFQGKPLFCFVLHLKGAGTRLPEELSYFRLCCLERGMLSRKAQAGGGLRGCLPAHPCCLTLDASLVVEHRFNYL